MPSLPTPGAVADNNIWGTELNIWLQFAHNADGSHQSPIHATVSTAYTVLLADAFGIIPGDASVTATFVITLMPAVSAPAGMAFTIRHLNASPTSNVINVTPAGAETIDLVTGAYPLSAKGGVTLVSNGVNGWIIKS